MRWVALVLMMTGCTAAVCTAAVYTDAVYTDADLLRAAGYVSAHTITGTETWVWADADEVWTVTRTDNGYHTIARRTVETAGDAIILQRRR